MIVTEKKRIKIDGTCKTNPVFAVWSNSKGGRGHWLFHKVQTEAIQTTEGGDFEPTEKDLENSRGQIIDASIFAQPQLIVNSSIMNEDMDGFKTILYSTNIEILVNPYTWETESPKWKIYRPLKGSFRVIDTDEVRTTFEITFNLPYINNPSK